MPKRRWIRERLDVEISRARRESSKVGASIGAAIYPDDAQDPEELISLADKAMYVAKRAGRSGAVAYVQMPTVIDSDLEK